MKKDEDWDGEDFLNDPSLLETLERFDDKGKEMEQSEESEDEPNIVDDKVEEENIRGGYGKNKNSERGNS